jgi:hypothetical protein
MLAFFGVREPSSRFWDCDIATPAKAAARLPHSTEDRRYCAVLGMTRSGRFRLSFTSLLISFASFLS